MEFAEFAARADEIEAETADLETIELVRELLVAADADLPVAARFVQGRVFPAWTSQTLDVGPSLCYEAIARAAGPNVTAENVEQRLAEEGEIGAVAESYDFGSQRGLGSFGDGGTQSLTVADVDAELRTLAAAAGDGSQDRKLDRLFGLFNRTDPIEARYLARLVLSEMRIGVGEGTVRDAIGEAFDVPVDAVERALQVTNDYGRVAVLAREEGRAGLEAVELELGRPVRAMLAQAGTATDALESWESVAVEPKFDGARVQIHHDPDGLSPPEAFGDSSTTVASSEIAVTTGSDSRVASADRTTAIFSRNMEDVTGALPEVVEFVAATATAPTILDGEVVAVDDDGTPLPFQEVLRRFRRKHDVDRAREAVTVELHAFDCLHVDGEDLLDVPLTERHERLESMLPESDAVATLRETTDADGIAAIEERALEAGHEGIMLKNPASPYSPGKRGQNWLKRKPDVETLDLVVTGAEWGEGRRANHFGTFELSARVDDGDGVATARDGASTSDGLSDGNQVGEYVTLGKVATGITDAQLADLTERLEPYVRHESGQTVEFEPRVVFEVGYEEIQQSPTYSSGYALRFPRFLGVREDKTPERADSLSRVERLASGQ